MYHPVEPITAAQNRVRHGIQGMSSNRAFQVGLCHFGQMPVRVLVPESQPEDIAYLCTEQEVVANFHAEVPQDFFHVVIEGLVA